MTRLVLGVAVENEDEMRALYQALLRARAEERSEADRINRLRGSGYGNESFDAQKARAQARYLMLDRLLAEVDTEMQAEGVEPW